MLGPILTLVPSAQVGGCLGAGADLRSGLDQCVFCEPQPLFRFGLAVLDLALHGADVRNTLDHQEGLRGQHDDNEH